MINPDNIAVDVDEQLAWLNEHRAVKNLSWSQLAMLTGIGASTIAAFGGGKYTGNKRNVAEALFRYRQTLESQETREIGVVTGPGYFETQTSARLRGLLTWAHRGRMTLAATSPGTGKTMTAKEYAASASNAWLVTMRPDVKTTNALALLVLRRLGVQVKGGWGAQLGDLVIDRVVGRNGLIIIDEANQLTLAQLELIRSWHDVDDPRGKGPGVCLFGNEELLARIESGATSSDAFARLHSRIASSHVQTMPTGGDVAAFCDAWGIADPEMRSLLERIATTPAAGGLRECSQIIEYASAIAADESRPLSFADLREAKATRATRNIH